VLCLVSSVLGQETGREERLGYDLFCVEWDRQSAGQICGIWPRRGYTVHRSVCQGRVLHVKFLVVGDGMCIWEPTKLVAILPVSQQLGITYDFWLGRLNRYITQTVMCAIQDWFTGTAYSARRVQGPSCADTE